jgi:hypothetical protein
MGMKQDRARTLRFEAVQHGKLGANACRELCDAVMALIDERDAALAALADVAIDQSVEWGEWTEEPDGESQTCVIRLGKVTVKVRRRLLDNEYTAEVLPCTIT